MRSDPTRADAPGEEDDVQRLIAEALAPELELVRPLGGGTVTAVYLAREPALRRLVAVKVLLLHHARNEKARIRFQREAQSAARISHPNVVSVHRVGTILGGVPYLVMQYVRGRTLADRLAVEPTLDAADSMAILKDVAAALHAAHEKNVLHRDVTPSNVLCEEATGRVLLADFGFAAILASGDEGSQRITTAGHIVGDVEYLCPELLRGEEPSARADVYCLGVLAFRMLVGRGPFTGSATEVVTANLEHEPVRLRELRADIPEELEDLVARCLRKVPEQRPTADEVARRLKTALEASPRWRRGDAGFAPGEPTSRDEIQVTDSQEHLERWGAGPTGRDVFRLRLLGGLELLAADGRSVMSVLAQPKRVAVLAVLAAAPDRSYRTRDFLSGMFWPDAGPERGRHALRQAVYVLRRSLAAEAILSRGDGEVGLNQDRIECDLWFFETAAEGGEAEEALRWYGGELLPGFYVSDCPEFERWLDEQRLRLRQLAAACAWKAAEAAEDSGDAVAARTRAARAMQLSPLDEGALHRLIELYERTGDRAGAVRAYEHFALRLAAEYETEPSPETQDLIARVRAAT